MGKLVTVLIRRPPLNSEKAAEALRVAVGYTLAAGQRVTACFIGDGVYAAGVMRPDLVGAPDLEKHLTSLKALGHRLVADGSAVRDRPGLTPRGEVEVLEPEAILELLTDSDLVVPF
ncbi:MAG TPA: DsrE family protein [Candidatus Methylomirabilis sp.]|nr:DsrE family protein [Candidatus Methylomirabilis sp.]